MVIQRGVEWGEPVNRPKALRIAADDSELAKRLADDRRAPITVRSGDVYRSVGAPPERDPMYRLPCDLLHVTVDNAATIAVAHVVARRLCWRGPIVGAFNVSEFRGRNAAPRAHPNDGLTDIVEVAATMKFRQRWGAYRRLATGSHVPHHDIRQRRATAVEWSFEQTMSIYVDGAKWLVGQRLQVTVEPDAYDLYV